MQSISQYDLDGFLLLYAASDWAPAACQTVAVNWEQQQRSNTMMEICSQWPWHFYQRIQGRSLWGVKISTRLIWYSKMQRDAESKAAASSISASLSLKFEHKDALCPLHLWNQTPPALPLSNAFDIAVTFWWKLKLFGFTRREKRKKASVIWLLVISFFTALIKTDRLFFFLLVVMRDLKIDRLQIFPSEGNVKKWMKCLWKITEHVSNS